MGRFFQGAKSDFLSDKMLELPYELMSQVIENTDKNIKSFIQSY